MNILFIHQNFPAQFKFLAPALVKAGHKVTALALNPTCPGLWNGIKVLKYVTERGSSPEIHPWLSDFETKIIRAEACYRAANKLEKTGFAPDLIIAHPGWGETLFIKEVWPASKLLIYCEFFYQAEGADVGFDPEFKTNDEGEVCRMHLKNLNNLMHFDLADAGLSPTHWQANSFPEPFRSKITVIHDGIDTGRLAPNVDAQATLNNAIKLTRGNEIITFVNRNLEPYRGYHIFMRSLPKILKKRPAARILIVGGDGVSYGARPNSSQSWKNIFLEEVRPQIPVHDWDRVHFLGHVGYEKFVTLLQLSTVHVYLTYPFVLSWSLLEAMSIGCAIIASDTAPVREVIVSNKTGRLVDFFDFEELSEAVCDLLDQPLIRKRLGQSARDFARQNYDLGTICLPRTLEFIHKL